jgi:dipicolinate synthase subunit B
MIETITQLKARYELNIVPIISEHSLAMDTRFGCAEAYRNKIEQITCCKAITTIVEAEPIGPKKLFDIMLIAPCTSNTMAKLANGITDNVVTMACKAHLRNDKPLLIAPATNDALGVSLQNIGKLIVRKNIFFVPFGQDNPDKKPLSMIPDFTQTEEALKAALDKRQLQPIILGRV